MDDALWGSPCPKCGEGKIQVANTRTMERSGVRVRYFGCLKCGFRPEENKQTVPLRFAPGRRLTMKKISGLTQKRLF